MWRCLTGKKVNEWGGGPGIFGVSVELVWRDDNLLQKSEDFTAETSRRGCFKEVELLYSHLVTVKHPHYRPSYSISSTDHPTPPSHLFPPIVPSDCCRALHLLLLCFVCTEKSLLNYTLIICLSVVYLFNIL